MSIATALPKIRQIAVQDLRPVKLAAIGGIAFGVLAVILIVITLAHPSAAASPAAAAQSIAPESVNTDPAVNVVEVQALPLQAAPALQGANAVQPAVTRFASFDADSSLMPGSALPASAQCGIAHHAPDLGNRMVRDCYARHLPGYSLVQFVGDASTGGILSTTFYVRNLRVRDLVNQWGSPLGYRTNNASSVVYWAGKRAYLTAAHLHGTDRIDFISFDDTPQQYQPWTALAD